MPVLCRLPVVEVKNQLGYIDLTEFDVKLAMCDFFGVKPFFATRVMPANYFYKVGQQDGYSFITQNQNYPLLSRTLARTVKEVLDLPVAVIQRLPDTSLTRFENWHIETSGV